MRDEVGTLVCQRAIAGDWPIERKFALAQHRRAVFPLNGLAQRPSGDEMEHTMRNAMRKLAAASRQLKSPSGQEWS